MGNSGFQGIAVPARGQRSHSQQESQNYPFEEEPQHQGGMHQGSDGGYV